MTQLLSIIVIGKNEGKNLDQVFTSVLSASEKFSEEYGELPGILYIDSQSSDNSIEIARTYNVPYLILKGKSSPGIARNLGAENTDSRFIFFLDGDTSVDRDFLCYGVEYLLNHKNVAGVGGMLAFKIFVGGSLKFEFNNYWNTKKDEEKIYDGVGGTFLYSKSDFDSAGGFSEEFSAGEEFDLMLRVVNSGKEIRRIKLPMAIHNDFKSAEVSYIKRYLLTKTIFLPGIIIHRAPMSLAVIWIILRRYWLHILYLPLIFMVLMLLFRQMLELMFIALSLMVILNFIHKKFSIKRTIISIISMCFFSFGLWAGLLLGSKIKS